MLTSTRPQRHARFLDEPALYRRDVPVRTVTTSWWAVPGARSSGSPGNDTIRGGGGRDVLPGAEGNDELVGGPGTDRANYFIDTDTARRPVTVNLAQGTATGHGRDTLAEIENVTGTAAGGAIVGNGGAANGIRRLKGRDNLSGAGGNDTLNGGAGKDTLAGGARDDTCIDGENNSACETEHSSGRATGLRPRRWFSSRLAA
jgi:Ca2+-binding RTX toxin-like protein